MKKMVRGIERSELGALFPSFVPSALGEEDPLQADSDRVSLTEQKEPLVLGALLKVIHFDEKRLALVNSFIEQVAEIHDPDAVETFLCWKTHPVLDTILLLAAKLDEDAQYEVLNLAEDLARDAGAGTIRRT